MCVIFSERLPCSNAVCGAWWGKLYLGSIKVMVIENDLFLQGKLTETLIQQLNFVSPIV